MPGFILFYIKYVDKFNYIVGRMAMYGIFVMVGILLWSSISKTFFFPSLWTLESAQFVMAAYYILGGAYAIQLKANVRMDLFYGNWSVEKRAWADLCTAFFLVFFLCVLLYGGLESMLYSWQYGQRTNTAWRPLIWPIKAVMCTGFIMMILQSISEFFKDVAIIRGVEIK